jgi:glycosyltransferase involved in cell wall biosynthesis
MESLKNQVKTIGLHGNIIFCGYVDSQEVFAYYSAADLFVILEKNVSFGLSIIEAHSCGLPALAFEGGGPSDIIEHGKNGFLQSPQATDTDIANQIVEYLTNEKLMQRMRKTAVESSQKYTWQNFATTFADIATGMSKCISDKS